MDQYIAFFTKHWFLTAAFIVVLIVIMFYENYLKAGGAQGVSAAGTVELMNHHDAVVLDIRDKVAFKQGHIVGAVNITADALDKSLNRIEKHKEQPVIVVASSDQAAQSVVQQLKQKEFKQPTILMGGMTAWRNASLPVEK